MTLDTSLRASEFAGLDWRPEQRKTLIGPRASVDPGEKKLTRDERLCHLQCTASELLRQSAHGKTLAEHDPGWRARMWEEVRRGEDWRGRFNRLAHMDRMQTAEWYEANYTVKLGDHWR